MRIFFGVFAGLLLITGCGEKSESDNAEKSANRKAKKTATKKAAKAEEDVKESFSSYDGTPKNKTEATPVVENKPPRAKEAVPLANVETASIAGETLAVVNGTAIDQGDFERAASRKIASDGKALNLEEKKEVIDRMVKDELLFQKAYEQKLYLDPKVKKVMLNALLREKVFSQVKNSDFSEQDLRTYFTAHKDEFTVPEKIQFSRILVKIKKDRDDISAKAEAERIYSQLKKNPDAFGETAEKFSDGPYRRRGGDVGFVSSKGKPGLPTEVVTAAFEMNKGQLSAPIKTKDGYNIIKIKERRAEMERTFEQMKGTVMRKLKNEKVAELYDSYTASLLSAATVEVDEEKLNNVAIKQSSRPTMGLPQQQGGMQVTPKGK